MDDVKAVIANNRYIQLIKQGGYDELYFAMIIIVNNEWIDELQSYLNLNTIDTLIEDGILGLNTLNVLNSALIDNPYTLRNFLDYVIEVKEDDVEEDEAFGENTLMNFLASSEGVTFHFNPKEKSYTTPYGVYRHAFPNSDIIKYSNSLFTKYGLNIHSKVDVRRINRRLKSNEKAKIKEMAWKFYKENFIDDRVLSVLDRLTSLSYLSIAINGGAPRGIKSLQSAANVEEDGIIGKITLQAVYDTSKEHSFKTINFRMLTYMKGFYDLLIEKKPAKYKPFEKGWFNRLLKTSCGIFK